MHIMYSRNKQRNSPIHCCHIQRTTVTSELIDQNAACYVVWYSKEPQNHHWHAAPSHVLPILITMFCSFSHFLANVPLSTFQIDVNIVGIILFTTYFGEVVKLHSCVWSDLQYVCSSKRWHLLCRFLLVCVWGKLYIHLYCYGKKWQI